ncbi:hypothetical protein K440DRAFT_672096 [Wilcoxina mikolae CBS 423.85]|nr:hypothetical protein K440DRAFT_672096 [Wilcoxina mikolae CBS 423.85]
MRFDYLVSLFLLLLLLLPFVNGDCPSCRTDAILELCKLESNWDPSCACNSIDSYKKILASCMAITARGCDNEDLINEEKLIDSKCSDTTATMTISIDFNPTTTTIYFSVTTTSTADSATTAYDLTAALLDLTATAYDLAATISDFTAAASDLSATASNPTSTSSDVQKSDVSNPTPASSPTGNTKVINSMSPKKIGAIVGGILGGLIAAILLGLGAFLVTRRRKRKAAAGGLEAFPGKEGDAGIAELSPTTVLSRPPTIPELTPSSAIGELDLSPEIGELNATTVPSQTLHELHG